MEDLFYKYKLERCVNQILESHACHSFAIAKTWQMSLGFKEAGIVDRPDTNSKIRAKGKRPLHSHSRARAEQPPGAGDREPGTLLAWNLSETKQQPRRSDPKHDWR
jgi:hypothetical protein